MGLAIIATVSGLIASTFAVSRMLAMLSEMNLVPHRHFGMPGSVQKHTLVYTVVLAITLTILFDLSRIASLGAIFYIVMDIAVHWGVLRHLCEEVDANPAVLITAIALDVLVLAAFLWMKLTSDILVIWVALGGITFIFGGERLFLRWKCVVRGVGTSALRDSRTDLIEIRWTVPRLAAPSKAKFRFISRKGISFLIQGLLRSQT